jgi:hypothetical protein
MPCTHDFGNAIAASDVEAGGQMLCHGTHSRHADPAPTVVVSGFGGAAGESDDLAVPRSDRSGLSSGIDSCSKAIVDGDEILGTVIEDEPLHPPRRYASSRAAALVENSNRVAAGHQCSRTSEPRDTRTDDRDDRVRTVGPGLSPVVRCGVHGAVVTTARLSSTIRSRGLEGHMATAM